ncbi:MAG TPA: hypothetical protein VN317_03445 [Candidatus Methanoperedens sp.]|nr:hypothetical protein [Candidatus Methanoperedens sp.]
MRALRRSTGHSGPLLWLAVLLCAGAGAAAAASPAESLAVFTSLEPAEIRVGDVARLTVTVDHPAAGVVALPELERGRAIRVSDRRRTTGEVTGETAAGRERTTFVVSLTSFEVGEHALGGGTIHCADEGGSVRAAPFPVTLLRVRSVLAGADAQPRGPRDPVRWPAPVRRWTGLAVGALLLAATVLAGASRGLARRRSRPRRTPTAETPHERALRALAALRRGELVDQRQVEQCIAELSGIVRRYLEERFGLRAPELTTEELVRETAGSGLLAPEHQEAICRFLAECDLVKFARHRPTADAVSRAFAAAERLVRETSLAAGESPAAQAVAGP